MYDREEFYHALLNAISAPVNDHNLNALRAWGECEGSQAEWNPLDTTQYEEGATAYNTFGNDQHVWNYPNLETGVKATASTLHNGFYPHILQAFKDGSGAIVSGDARSEMRVWGTNPDCIEGKIGNVTTESETPQEQQSEQGQEESTLPPHPLTEPQREFVSRLQRALSEHLHPLVEHDKQQVERLIKIAKEALHR